MYLTAQRPEIGAHHTWPGINAYLYWHGRDWSGRPPPNLPAAEFGRGHELVASQPGRRVLSYVDLVAPDNVVVEELHRAVAHIHRAVVSQARPWVHICGRCQITFLVDPSLDKVWHAELHLLWDEAERLLTDESYVTAIPGGAG